MKVTVKVIKSFALPGQGLFVEGEEVELLMTRRAPIGIVHPDRYERLLEQGHIEVQNGGGDIAVENGKETDK